MPDTNEQRETAPHTAGAFDIRTIIGGLIGAYGVVLVLMGLFNATDEELAKADGINVNLWAGIGMVVFGAAFLLWVRLRPTVVPAEGTEAAGAGDDVVGGPTHYG